MDWRVLLEGCGSSEEFEGFLILGDGADHVWDITYAQVMLLCVKEHIDPDSIM